jgi:nitroimidazol reductase NimA-like FMN-containing flavoprotein (pyridoxamine 5'-phosphate oxidase superfamily)
MSTTQPNSDRTTVRRHAERGRYDAETIHAILDEGLVGHLAFVAEGQPIAVPMLYARSGEEIYLHGSPRSRVLGVAGEGVPVCLTVTLIDGLVLARSAFHHSMNYRSVVVLGRARSVEDRDEKVESMRLLVDHVVPGRTADARGPSAGEIKTTEMLAMSIDEASAKVRTGPPIDSKRDLKLPVWAGVLPLRLAPQSPVADEHCDAAVPSYVTFYRRPGDSRPDAA